MALRAPLMVSGMHTKQNFDLNEKKHNKLESFFLRSTPRFFLLLFHFPLVAGLLLALVYEEKKIPEKAEEGELF